MRKLIGELITERENYSLRYLLFEESKYEYCENIFFSLIVELRDEKHDEYAEASDFTRDRSSAETMLQNLCLGTVTPVGLPYIIEDYLADI